MRLARFEIKNFRKIRSALSDASDAAGVVYESDGNRRVTADRTSVAPEKRLSIATDFIRFGKQVGAA